MPDHVRRLRERVGTDLLLLPSVSVFVRDEQERVLLVRHADSGQWGLVGGAIEVDERPEDAAARKAQEETGLLVQLGDVTAVLGGPAFRLTYPNGDETAYVSVVYEARVTGGTQRPDLDGIVETGWFRAEELAMLDLGPFAQATLDDLGLSPGSVG